MSAGSGPGPVEVLDTVLLSAEKVPKEAVEMVHGWKRVYLSGNESREQQGHEQEQEHHRHRQTPLYHHLYPPQTRWSCQKDVQWS